MGGRTINWQNFQSTDHHQPRLAENVDAKTHTNSARLAVDYAASNLGLHLAENSIELLGGNRSPATGLPGRALRRMCNHPVRRRQTLPYRVRVAVNQELVRF
jgi:hypothetical protein